MSRRNADVRRHRLGWVVAVAALAFGCTTTQPLEFGDRHLVVTVESFASHAAVGSLSRSQGETIQKRRWFDGTIEVEYEFEPPEESAEIPFLYSLFELHPTSAAACASFTGGNLGTELGGDVEVHDELFRYGDKSRYGFFLVDGERAGTFFNMCRSRTALLVLLVGLTFEDAEAWSDVIAPHLRAIEEYEQSRPAR